MAENIQVGIGVGKIENNYGTVNVNSKEFGDTFKVRLDLKNFEQDIFQLYQYGKIFEKNNRENWSHLKNNEDFGDIYLLPFEQRNIFENIYRYGRDCAIAMSSELMRINDDFEYYPNLVSITNRLENNEYIANIDIFKQRLLDSENLTTTIENQYFSIKKMNRLYKEQINLLNNIREILMRLRATNHGNQRDSNIFHNAPDDVKKGVWYWNLIKQYPFKGSLIIVFLTVFYNFSITDIVKIYLEIQEWLKK